MQDLDESLSGSDSSDSEDDEDGNARKETTLSALLKKQANIAASNNPDDEETNLKMRNRGSGKAPLLWFTTPTLPANTYLGIYRAIFTDPEQANLPNILSTIQGKQLTPKPQSKIAANESGIPLPPAYKEPHIFLCMIGGGHFAAMIVSLSPRLAKSSSTGPLSKEATVIAHKTFHRYTTRRKQGGSQSANDSAKGNAHSAGASIRRYNEQALTDEVRQLLLDWKDMIHTSELIFIRATGNTNRRTLYGPYEGQILKQNDNRIRGFPFNTRRATQSELMRAFIELTRVKIHTITEADLAASKVAPTSTVSKSSASKKPETPKVTEEEALALTHTKEIHLLIKRQKLPALLSYLSTHQLSPNYPFHPPTSKENHHAPTPLHLAASSNSPPLVTGLLVKGHADPTLKSADGKTPFELAGDRATRDAFRVARHTLGEKAFDWNLTSIPAPITLQEAQARDVAEKKEAEAAEKARRKAEAERLKREGPQVTDGGGGIGKAQGRGRMIALQKTAQDKREEEARGMTPEMRMRLERERRARAAEERMKKAAGGS